MTLAKEKGLGKGLGALFETYGEEPVGNSPYQLLPIYKVEPTPGQPRQDFDEVELQALADSITQHGIVQPLTVRELSGGYYQIIAGERRWRAARLAGLSEIPAVIIEADDKKMLLYIDDLYPEFHLGLNACEGINRFYELEII